MKFAKALVQAGRPCCIPLCMKPDAFDQTWDLVGFTGSWATIQQNNDGQWQLCLTAAANQATETLTIRSRNCKENDGSYRYTDELMLAVETENTNVVFSDTFPGGAVDLNTWRLQFPWGVTGGIDDQINHNIEGQMYSNDLNGGNFSACGADGLKITAMGPAGATSGYGDRPWTSGMIHQINAEEQLGGVYTIRLRGSQAKGAFPGTWAIGKHGGCTEIDTSEGGNTQHPDSVHQAYHLIGDTGTVDTSEWVPVCKMTDDACHDYAFHYRITDRLDADGCRIMQGAMTVDCIVSQDWVDVDFREMLHHISNLAVATLPGWSDIGNPPDQTSMDICICEVETREYTDGKSEAFPAFTEPTISTTGQVPLPTNNDSDYMNINQNPNPQFTVTPGSVAGATMVRRDYILDCVSTQIQGTTFQLTTQQAFKKSVYVRERYRAANGTCFDVMSDAVYMGE